MTLFGTLMGRMAMVQHTLTVTNLCSPVGQVYMNLLAGKFDKKLTSLHSKRVKVDGVYEVPCGTTARRSSKRRERKGSIRGKAFALLRRLVQKTRMPHEPVRRVAPKSCATPGGGVERLECGAELWRSTSVTSKPQEVVPPNDHGINLHYMGGSDCSRQSIRHNGSPVQSSGVRACLVDSSEQLRADACSETPGSGLHKPPVAPYSRRRWKRTSAYQATMKDAKKLGASTPDSASSFPSGHASIINSVAIDDDCAALSGGRSHTVSPSQSGANNNGGSNRTSVSEETTGKHQEGFGAGRTLRLFRSSSLSPRSSWRVGLKPSPPRLLTHFTYPSSEGEFPVFSAGHLMSIRGSKVKTSPRHSGGASSLSVPSSPKSTALPSPPRVVPPHLRKHRRTVSALAQSFFTTGNSFRGREPLESPMHEGGTRNSIRSSPRSILRRLKSMSGGLVASEGGEGRGEKYRVEPGVTKLYTLDAKAVAEELTVLDAEIFRRIKMNELRNGAWTKKDKEQLAPNVMQMVRAFNRLALLTTTEVLSRETPQLRAKVITAYLQIAEKLYHLQNFNSLKAVLAGLESAAVFRLEKTWACISNRRKRLFSHLCLAVSNEDNWKIYRKLLNEAISRPPCIPFLGQLLTDITQKDTYSSQRCETLKEKKMAATTPQTAPEHVSLEEDRQKEQSAAGEDNSPFCTSTMACEEKEACRRRPRTLLPIKHQSVAKCHSHPQSASGGNSRTTTPSPSSTASRLSDSGFSSYSCPDLIELLTEWNDHLLARLCKRRRSTSAKTVGEPLSAYVETLNGDLENSGSSGSLNNDDNPPEIRVQKSASVLYDEATEPAVVQMLSKLADLSPNKWEENGTDELDIERLLSSKDLSQSSFSSLEELLSLEDDATEDKVFRSREHTPGHELDEVENSEVAQSSSFPSTPDLDLEDISVALQHSTEEHAVSNGTADKDSPISSTAFRTQRNGRFSSFRKRAQYGLKGLIGKQQRKRHKTLGSPLPAPAPTISEILQALQFATLGYCESCGPQVAIRRFLLTAECNTEAENYRLSTQLEPLEAC